MTVKTIHSTQKTLDGPWLLDDAALKEVDHLFADYQQAQDADRQRQVAGRVEEHLAGLARHSLPDNTQQQLREKIEKDVQEMIPAPTRRVSLWFGPRKKIVGNSLREVGADPYCSLTLPPDC